jgi:uncharacterized protein YutE (UPF0331/DUF86 family)
VSNYLVITTTLPENETIQQLLKNILIKTFKLRNLINNTTYLHLEIKIIKTHLTNKNIIVCSKQFQCKIEKVGAPTTEKTKTITWLKTMNFEMRFFD